MQGSADANQNQQQSAGDSDRLVPIWLAKAAVWRDSGRPELAIQYLAGLLEELPDLTALRSQLAADLIAAGQYQQALAQVDYLGQEPDNEAALAIADTGLKLAASGQYDKAAQVFRVYLKHIPGNHAVWHNLGLALIECNQPKASGEALEKAIALSPQSAIYRNSLGNYYMLFFKVKEAVEQYSQAVRLEPDYQAAVSNLGRAWRLAGDFEQSLPLIQRAIQMDPTSQVAVDNYLYYQLYAVEDAAQVADSHIRLVPVAYPATAKPLAGQYVQKHQQPRVGFVSPDFRNHPVVFFMEPVLKCWQHNRFKLFCYYQVYPIDDTTRRLMEYGGTWRSTVGMSDEALAKQIQADGIDLLIDLAGHTEGHRLPMFAMKPAPVQATWLGYPNTTGLPQMDFRLTDAVADPPGQTEHLHTEQLIYMPDIFLSFTPMQNPPCTPLPEPEDGQLTLCSFNNLSKISDITLGLWGEIMAQLPKARLLLKFAFLGDELSRQVLQYRLAKNGIEQSRVDMLGFTDTKESHLALYGTANLALDSYPYHGTTTTCEALWMGVPVITLAGAAHVSRVSVSILTAIGCTELIAENKADYVAKAVALARDRARQQYYRHNLRSKMLMSPLTDNHRFVKNIGDAFQQMLDSKLK